MVYVKKYSYKKDNPFVIFSNKLCGRGLGLKGFNICLYLLSYIKFNLKKKLKNKIIFKYFFDFVQLYVNIYRKKVGGNVHSVPLYIRKELRLRKGLSNFFKIIKTKKDFNLKDKVVKEFVDVLQLKGSTISARNNIYMLAAEEKTNMRFIVPKHKVDYKPSYNIIVNKHEENNFTEFETPL
jgi:hypothetical protein